MEDLEIVFNDENGVELYRKDVTYYSVDDWDILNIKADDYTIVPGKRKIFYYNVACAFDIETTTVETGDNYVGFMYQWQFAIGDKVVFGRRWEEFVSLLELLINSLHLRRNRRLVIYSHALMFEFQFLRNFVEVSEMFARQKRVPLKFVADECIEFRCSYALSNMSLSKFIKNTPNAVFYKRDGDKYDYNKIRTPDTELTSYELGYCYCDVAGLVEALNHLLENDTIGTIPLTSTGFVRRTVGERVRSNKANREILLNTRLNDTLYVLCKTASRGGNSHANAFYSNEIVYDMDGYDIKSSYPAYMLCGLFPITQFQIASPYISTVENYLYENAMLIDCTYYNVKLKKLSTIPYISVAKCTAIRGLNVDNGRVVLAQCISTVITDIDYRIIKKTYDYTEIEIRSVYVAGYGKLNKEFRESLMEMFREKTALENGDPYLYAKFKNRINAYFGMMLTDICAPEIEFAGNVEVPWLEKGSDINGRLDQYYKNKKSFLSYQHGIWTTAGARERLQQAIDMLGDDIVYVDTDSAKYVEKHDDVFDKLNEDWLAVCDNNDISPYVDLNGKRTVMGLWEKDAEYSEFKTLGAKKYIFKKKGSDKYAITVAGLSKEKGSAYLNNHGGIENFKIGYTVPEFDSGRTCSYFNDVDKPYYMTCDNSTFITASNIGVKNVPYTFGVSDDYWEYLLQCQELEYSENEKEIIENEKNYEE